MKAPFPIQPELTAIAIAYMNTDYIADAVLPRVGVGTQEFKYMKYDTDERYTIPETRVGRTSQPNEVEFGATELTSSTQDYGLDDPVPQADIENAPVNFDPLGNSVEGTTDLILLDREKRAADLVFSAANYVTGQKATLSGTGQWSDYTNSDPISAILTAFDTMLVRPNVGVIGQAVFTKLRQHPKIAKAVHGNSGDVAVVARQAIADLLELNELIVGSGFYNTAKKGQTASFGRLWGKHAAFHYRDPNANTRRGVTFGLTAQWGDRISGSEADSKIGLRGGQRVRVGESVKELIVSAEAGYLFTNAVA